MVLDKSKYFFSFNSNLEILLFNYLRRSSKKEIFIGFLGTISGKKNRLHYKIKDLIPFPNLSDTPNFIATPPKEWLLIIEERRLFLNNKLKLLGFIHSHPGESSRKSELDDQFGLYLLDIYGPILMIIIGYNFTLRCYLIDEDKTKIISGDLKFFDLKKQ